ncbi:hypothetical protein BY996DRAFT_6414557 [Phakopsora pachyrhizi]|nr:hypothetical protein BY996DRAFT_6414557 [Phakopsora pachyrhizi]
MPLSLAILEALQKLFFILCKINTSVLAPILSIEKAESLRNNRFNVFELLSRLNWENGCLIEVVDAKDAMSPHDCKLRTSCFAVTRFVLAPATPKADREIAGCLHIPTPTNNTAPCPPVGLRDFTLMSDNWKDGTNGFTEVHQYKTPYEHVCCQAAVGRSKKCEECRVLKITCKFDSPQVLLEGRKVWRNPRIKAYGYEHPIPEVPTSDYNLGIISTLP